MVIDDTIHIADSDDDTHTLWCARLATGIINAADDTWIPVDGVGSGAYIPGGYPDVWQEGELQGACQMVYV